jgi:hypothetical protein
MATQVVDFLVPGGYVRREEVMSRLDCSEATVDRMARDERLKSRLVPVPGRKSERVYLAEDVERHQQVKEKREALRPPPGPKLLESGGTEKAEVISLNRGIQVHAIRELLESWAAARSEEVPIREKLWLTWKEAAALSGIPLAYVKLGAKEGRVVARRFGRSWRVQRASLEESRW